MAFHRAIRCSGIATFVAMLLASVSTSSTAAHASCGDWLQGHSDHHSAARAYVTIETQPKPALLDVRHPCRNGACGQGPTRPAPDPAPLVVPAKTDCVCCLTSVSFLMDHLDSFCLATDDPAPMAAVCSPLEHPPRA
jgi:hypothetical protein